MRIKRLAEAQARLAQERSELARLEVGTRREIVANQAELRSAQAREREHNIQTQLELVAAALSRRTLVEARAAADAAWRELASNSCLGRSNRWSHA